MRLPHLCWTNQQKTAGTVPGSDGKVKGGDAGMTARLTAAEDMSLAAERSACGTVISALDTGPDKVR